MSSAAESVGTLLAAIANLIGEGLRILSFSDKHQWGPDEHEQHRALDETLDEAKKDFQDLSPLVNGQLHYENDRTRMCFPPHLAPILSSTSAISAPILLLPCPLCLPSPYANIQPRRAARPIPTEPWLLRHEAATDATGPPADESLVDLRTLLGRFESHIATLKDWTRTGGPINPMWVRETRALQRDLHRAQCRVARRIFLSSQESATTRCLGAFLVRRKQRAWSNRQVGVEEGEYQRRYLEELMACNRVGSFIRFGEDDIAFVCDFCDGHIVWEDLEKMPSVRVAQEQATWTETPMSPTEWQATGFTRTNHEPKKVVFAPMAIANHMPPIASDWQARLLCVLCKMEAEKPRDKDDEDDLWQPDNEYEDVTALLEHLEWQHTTPPASSLAATTNDCQIM